MDKITNEIADLHFEEKSSILHIEIRVDANMSLKNLKEHYRTIKKITKGKEYSAMINARNFYTIDLLGIEYSGSAEAVGNRISAAYFAPSMANRLNINFLKIAHHPGIPIDIFESEEDALRWTKKQKSLHKVSGEGN